MDAGETLASRCPRGTAEMMASGVWLLNGDVVDADADADVDVGCWMLDVSRLDRDSSGSFRLARHRAALGRLLRT